MSLKLNNFFTSGLILDGDWKLKSQYQMLNMGIVLSSLALVYGIIGNITRDVSGGIIEVEIFLLIVNILLFFILRSYKNSFKIVSLIVTTLFSFFFLYLVYQYEPNQLKHIWLFTFPIILLFFQEKKSAIYWIILMVSILLLAPLQGIIEVQYSLFQIVYLCVVLIIVSVIIYFYQYKMDEARDLVLEQQIMLKTINEELAKQVKELKLQDKLLSTQSKQAVMGEMISMIAHQWRQPLSTATLQIASLKIKKELGQKIYMQEVDKILGEVSDNIVYLSDTIDDFQTYFHPNKEKSEIVIDELIQRAINFSLPRLQETKIEIEFTKGNAIVVYTYINELIQVLLNIINNAVDALIQDNIKEPKVFIGLKQIDKNALQIKIVDNANGIAKKNIEHLFEPYFSTKAKNGTGLGLYMSQMIMQKQFGTHIEVKTSKFGTMFIVEIPINIR